MDKNKLRQILVDSLDAITTYGPEYMHAIPKKHYTKQLVKAIAEIDALPEEPVMAVVVHGSKYPHGFEDFRGQLLVAAGKTAEPEKGHLNEMARLLKRPYFCTGLTG